MHSKIIKVKSIEDISLINVEVNSYKYSAEIADFNYDENKKILNQLSQCVLDETTISNILYVASLIELLGSKYINTIIRLHKHNFMIDHTEFANEINKYIDYLVSELPKGLEESDTDLLNIRDEMLSELNKLKYLLTLE